MKVALLCRKFVVLHAIGSVMLSGPLRASEPVRSEVKTQTIKPLDVKLDKKAGFTGQLVNASGKPQSRAVVELRRDNEVVETIRTDKEGRFAFAGLRTGVYEVTAPDAAGLYRVWANRVAPPSAQHEVLLVQGDVVRGQQAMLGPGAGLYDGHAMRVLSNPWVFAGVIAAGVAIPVAISQNDDGEGS